MFRSQIPVVILICLGGCPVQDAALIGTPDTSPLAKGIYSGQIATTLRTISATGTTEQTSEETVTLAISERGIPIVDGAEITTGRIIRANLGSFTQTITYRSVLVTDDGVIITSDVANSNGSAGVAVATFRPNGTDSIVYTLEQDIRSDVERLAASSQGVLSK